MQNCTAALIPAANDDYSLFLCVQALAEAFDEVVILDDASEDETPQVIEWLRSRYVHLRAARSERPLGWAEARNELALLTNARHLFFVDADDILLDRQVPALKALVDSPAAHVRLGLAEIWGDFQHGTGRGIARPHFDPCHCYIDRARCPDARWTCQRSYDYPSLAEPPAYSREVLFWHAKGVKSDWRLVARTHVRQWIQSDRSTPIGDWPAFVRDQHAVHEQAVRRLLSSRTDPIQRLPAGTEIPQVCRAASRFRMVYEDGRIVDRTDSGWQLRDLFEQTTSKDRNESTRAQ